METENLTPASSMIRHKLTILGDTNVGKTSIITRFCDGTFSNNYAATIGFDCLFKTVNLDEKTHRFQLWDTSGQERFRSLIHNCIRASSVILIVFSVTDKQTFDNVERWIEAVKNERGADAIMALVGNKIDSFEERCVTSEEAAAKAAELGAFYVEVSAKMGVNIKNLFNPTCIPAWENISSASVQAPKLEEEKEKHESLLKLS